MVRLKAPQLILMPPQVISEQEFSCSQYGCAPAPVRNEEVIEIICARCGALVV